MHLEKPVIKANKIGFPTSVRSIINFPNPNSSVLGNTLLLGKKWYLFPLPFPSPSKYLGYVICYFLIGEVRENFRNMERDEKG